MDDYRKKIRESSEGVKQMFIIGFSVALCAVFFAGWVWYMKGVTAMPETSETSMTVPEGVSFPSTIRSGLADVGQAIGGFLKNLGRTRDIEVKP
jgi:hypothetical protein